MWTNDSFLRCFYSKHFSLMAITTQLYKTLGSVASFELYQRLIRLEKHTYYQKIPFSLFSRPLARSCIVLNTLTCRISAASTSWTTKFSRTIILLPKIVPLFLCNMSMCKHCCPAYEIIACRRKLHQVKGYYDSISSKF